MVALLSTAETLRGGTFAQLIHPPHLDWYNDATYHNTAQLCLSSALTTDVRLDGCGSFMDDKHPSIYVYSLAALHRGERGAPRLSESDVCATGCGPLTGEGSEKCPLGPSCQVTL